ncbi:MAG: hypothetical protein ACPGGK_11610 [Pikeienuella sp.]
MNEPRGETDRRAQRARKRHDAAALITLVGVLIFATPLISALTLGPDTAAIPSAVLYIFGAWGALIVVGALSSRALDRELDAEEPEE